MQSVGYRVDFTLKQLAKCVDHTYVHQNFAFCQLQCELVQRILGWTSSLGDFNVVDCMSQ